jgi:hypothetical protein
LLQELLARTIGNLAGQTSPKWRAILLCHEKPPIIDGLGLSEHLLCLEVGGDVPTTPHEMMEDKRRKTSIGIQEAFHRSSGDDWVCILDPDDLIHKDVTKFVMDHPVDGGWFISQGYAATRRPKLVEQLDDFESVCGSSFFLRLKLWGNTLSDRGRLVDMVNRGHHLRRELFRGEGLPLEAIPFRAGIYTIETGDNWSGSYIAACGGLIGILRRLRKHRLVSSRIRSEFPFLTE